MRTFLCYIGIHKWVVHPNYNSLIDSKDIVCRNCLTKKHKMQKHEMMIFICSALFSFGLGFIFLIINNLF